MTTHHDPVTGDDLTTAEYVSWRIQGVIRNFWFLGGFTLLTVLWLWLGTDAARGFWNYFASYLAIVVESIVGIAMFSQTRRDAVIIRRLLRLEERILHDVEDENGQYRDGGRQGHPVSG
jgi:glucan phosphoethanolaminetransferase (alkaline phosphatase superfamily)